MTVYRRRLTSSLYAVHQSLERRIETLQDQASVDDLLDDDDRFALENAVTFEPGPAERTGTALRRRDRRTPPPSSKTSAAASPPTPKCRTRRRHRAGVPGGPPTVVVFTQFTDTLDWLRDQLQATYGSKIACYTGDGGSRWNPERRRLGETPQRRKSRNCSGRVTRSGSCSVLTPCPKASTCRPATGSSTTTCRGTSCGSSNASDASTASAADPPCTITNYFYNDTVEEQVYSGIKEDAEWFEQVVGPAQPVLSQVESVIENLAMRGAGDSPRSSYRAGTRSRFAKPSPKPNSAPVPSATLENTDIGNVRRLRRRTQPSPSSEIEQIITAQPADRSTGCIPTRTSIAPATSTSAEKHPMTFDREVYDRNPESGT